MIDHTEAIEANLNRIRSLEAKSVRITQGPAGRCFEQADGRLLTIRNEQANSKMLHLMYITPLVREDAEDFYGWSRA